MKCYTWSMAFYVAETWTLRKIDQKHCGSFEMWCWRRMEKISSIDRAKNEVLHRVKEERNILLMIKRKKVTWISHTLCTNCLLKHVIEENIEGKRRRGRKHKQLLDDLKEKRIY
jgi:hypothetical protein